MAQTKSSDMSANRAEDFTIVTKTPDEASIFEILDFSIPLEGLWELSAEDGNNSEL
jgi:hypothetical protein